MSAALTRRRLLTGASALGGIGISALAADRFGLFARRWPPSPYDDLLNRLPLREQAVILGQAVLASNPTFRPAPAAARLRQQMASRGAGQIAAGDADTGHVLEASGWVLPSAVAELSALAALAAQPRQTAGA